MTGRRFGEKKIKNDPAYRAIEKLTKLAKPTSETKFDMVWENFYLPVRRSGRVISVPFRIMKYKHDFYVHFRFMGGLKISRGEEKIEKEYGVFEEVMRFIPIVKSTKGKIIKETVPYDFRLGKIKGRYVMNKVMPEKEKTRLLKSYDRHLKKNLIVSEISLNDYLKTAAVCYKGAYREAKKLSLPEMYKKWADGRHGGMLDIRDLNGKDEFTKWYKSGEWSGSHPFEIVFSWHRHGIHIYPPGYGSSHYSLKVTDYAYARDFIKMVKALIKEEIPFQSLDFDDVLSFLTGEKYFTVNDHDELSFMYIPSREYKNLYFKHIEWEDLQLVELN